MIRIYLVVLLFIITIQSFSQNTVWKYKTEGRVYSSPLIIQDKIFIGSNDKNLYCLNKNAGNLIWKKKLDGKINSDPIDYKGLVIVASSDGKLVALNQKDGTMRWEFDSKIEKQIDLWDYYISSPVIDGQYVFWGSADGEERNKKTEERGDRFGPLQPACTGAEI